MWVLSRALPSPCGWHVRAKCPPCLTTLCGPLCAGCVLAAGGQVITFGQYLRPSKKHLPIHEYVTPEAFDQWRVEGERMGFLYVASGPLVRSSYKAGGETQCAAFPVGLHAIGGVVCWGFTPWMAFAALATLKAQHACVCVRTPGFLPYARGVGLPSLPPPPTLPLPTHMQSFS